ncbi:MAG: OmpH family outer membrane protein [bacterium]
MANSGNGHTTRVGLWLVVILLAGGVLLPAAALADDKPLAVVDSQRIVTEYPAARDAQEQYEKFLRELEKEIGDKETSLQALAEEIESQKMLLGEDALAAKMQEFDNLRAEYFEFQGNIEERAEREYKDKIGPIIDQVRTIAERLGKEDGFGIIIDSAALTVLYLDSAVDLTDKVLEALVRGEE